MSSFHNNALVGASGQAGYQIERSLRFNSADSAYLNRTPASAGNRKTWTISWWMKKTSNGSAITFFDVLAGSAGNPRGYIQFTSTDTLELGMNPTGASFSVALTTTQVFRDPSSWYHFVVNFDTTQATASDRIKVYVNGSQITAFSTASYPSQNTDQPVNQNVEHRIGYTYNNLQAINGYLTEIHFIDGQALTPSSFCETDTITGVWKPTRYAGTYGTNGFYLKFADNSGTTSTTLGKDSSGNSNNWTPNNFSVTAGAGNDSMIDTPTPYADGGNGRGNYCTLNPLDDAGNILSNGNLDIQGTGNTFDAVRSTIAMSSGKWYSEFVINTESAASRIVAGLLAVTDSNDGYLGDTAKGYSIFESGSDVRKYNNLISSVLTSSASLDPGDVQMIAFNADTGKLWFGKNGTWFASGNPAAGTNEVFSGLTSGPYAFATSAYNTSDTGTFNFGQRAFAYTPPSGFLALNTQNLPEPSIKKPNQWMDATTYTGTSASNAIVNAGGFQPDLVWLKNRNYAPGTNHVLVDAVRGVSLGLASNLTNAEFSTVGNFSSINSNGFTVTGTTRDYNFLNDTFVAWQWKESATPGFDIVTYTGNGGTQNISHTLGVVPRMIIIKDRSAVTNWYVYHTSLGTSQALLLSTTNAAFAPSPAGVSAVSSSNFTLGGARGETNTNAENYVAYLWSEVAGFSKFGSYTGNGSADGPFVFCGFRPRWVMIKRTDGAGSWFMIDTARATYNVVNPYLMANVSNSEATDLSWDILSNGFKLRSSYVDINASSGSFAFAAFSENPFKYSLAR